MGSYPINSVPIRPAKSSDYSGNALHVKTSRSANAAFNLLYAESNGADTFTLKGSGDVVMAKGGLTITSGGQTITAGGLTVTAGVRSRPHCH